MSLPTAVSYFLGPARRVAASSTTGRGSTRRGSVVRMRSCKWRSCRCSGPGGRLAARPWPSPCLVHLDSNEAAFLRHRSRLYIAPPKRITTGAASQLLAQGLTRSQMHRIPIEFFRFLKRGEWVKRYGTFTRSWLNRFGPIPGSGMKVINGVCDTKEEKVSR